MLMGMSAGGSDTTAPTLSTATIGMNGTTWTFVFSEIVSIGAGGSAGWAVTMANAGAVTLTYASGSGSTTLVYTGNVTVYTGDTVSSGLNYTQPGNGIEDAKGNDLANISGKAVTNNTTQVWLPTVITGCVLHLRADLGVTGSAPVTGWADQSTSSNDVIVGYEQSGCVLTANAINGKPAMAFTGGAGTCMHLNEVTNFPTGNGTFTWFVVMKAAVAATQYGVFHFGAGVGNDGIALYTALAGAGFASMEFNGGYGYRPAVGTPFTDDTYFWLLATKAAGNINATCHLYKNGVEWTGGTASDGTPTLAYDTTLANKHMPLGGWDGYSPSFTGQIAEFGLWSNVISAASITALASYISTRYGL